MSSLYNQSQEVTLYNSMITSWPFQFTKISFMIVNQAGSWHKFDLLLLYSKHCARNLVIIFFLVRNENELLNELLFFFFFFLNEAVFPFFVWFFSGF